MRDYNIFFSGTKRFCDFPVCCSVWTVSVGLVWCDPFSQIDLWEKISERLKPAVPYSATIGKNGLSTVRFSRRSIRVSRKKLDCSRIKNGSCRHRKNSNPYCGYQEDHVPDLPQPERLFDDEGELLKAIGNFYFFQTTFPAHCKHLGTIAMHGTRKSIRFDQQRKAPNWIVKNGVEIDFPNDGNNDRLWLPDIVDCDDFDIESLKDGRAVILRLSQTIIRM